MKYEGTTYRPPVEANSLLLQVTVGCAHNSCTFCNMYRDVRFRASSLKEIEEDLAEARNRYRHVERIFLVNGDAFVLSASRLKAIAERIIAWFPECETITMYASIQNIAHKSDAELQELKNLRINDLYVGLESGSQEVVRAINKGYTVDEASKQLQRLNRVGIRHAALPMLGVAGSGKGIRNAWETACFLNETRPSLVWVGTLGVFEGTELYTAVRNGEFVIAAEREIMEEEIALLNDLELADVPFYGVHPTNVASVSGVLPFDRQKMVARIDRILRESDPKILNSCMSRCSL